MISLPVRKSAPPSIFDESLPDAIVTEDVLKLDLDTVTLSPVRHIVPPLELEVPELIPLLLVHVILYIIPSLPSQYIAPPSSSAMLFVNVEL